MTKQTIATTVTMAERFEKMLTELVQNCLHLYEICHGGREKL